MIKTDPDKIIEQAEDLFNKLDSLPLEKRVACLNKLRRELHKHSPFKSEPVDCVRWVKSDKVVANDYNPNSVAPPEMKLLAHSIDQDGYTQPIVGYRHDGIYEVVDGFHRHRVGKEVKTVVKRVLGYLPVAVINRSRQKKSDRIAATIRHNRARGKHRVEAMSDIVVELKRRNWSDARIAKELGMDADEVLRLCQITGLAELFKDQKFSQAWEVAREQDGAGGELLSDLLEDEETDDGDRVLHTWDKRECYRAGFYAERPPEGMTQEQGEEAYREFLSDLPRFEKALRRITKRWKHSCEHYLTNDRMNRIAWLGQAALAYALKIPSCCRGGYRLLTDVQKQAADKMALKWLNRWLRNNGKKKVTMEQAGGRTEAELY